MGPRAKEASLVVCIVLLASTVALASEHIVPPVFGVKIQPVVAHGSGSGPSPGPKSKVGTLLIEATASSGFVNPLYIFATPYMSDVGVTVVPMGPAPLYPKTYETNSTGGLELSLPPSNYSISFFASAGVPINASVLASVYQGETTLLQLSVGAITYQPVYVGMPANQTNVVPAWASGTLELSSSGSPGSPAFIAPEPVSAAFLDLYYNATMVTLSSNQTVEFSFKTPVQVPLLITGWSLRGPPSGSEQWIDFQPEIPVSLDGITSMGVSMYYVTTNVTTTQTVSYGGIPAAD